MFKNTILPVAVVLAEKELVFPAHAFEAKYTQLLFAPAVVGNSLNASIFTVTVPELEATIFRTVPSA